MTDQSEALNAIARSHAMKENTKPKLKNVTAGLAFKFWERLLQNSRSALLLVEYGYVNEAMTIQRLSIENFAYAAALLRGKLTEQAFTDEMDVELRSQAEKMRQSDEQDSTLTPENRAKLENFLASTATHNVKKPGHNIYDALKSCGLEFFYTRYRELSVRAAHAKLLSAVSASTAAEIDKLLLGIQEPLAILDAIAIEVAAHAEDSGH